MQKRFMNHGWWKAAVIVFSGMVLCWAPAALAEATWTQLVTANSPSNVHHDATYDSANQRIVLCGRANGGFGPTAQAQCYFFSLGGGWQTGPVINSSAGNDIEVSYDSTRAVTVLYTVTNNTIPLVFELVGNVWTQRTFATQPVASPDGALMRYDSVRQKTVLVGCTNAVPVQTANSETWLWDGTNWTQVAGSPPGAAGGSMTFDEARGVMVLLPFYATNTWTFDGTTWTSHQTAHVPTDSVWVAKMAYDHLNELAIEFGGEAPATYPTNTWAWNGSDWQILTTTNYPPATIDMAMLWFPPMNSIIMHGGWGPGDSWAWRNAVWVFSNSPSLSAPQGVTASKGAYSNKVAVAWQSVASATGYRVYRNDSNETANATIIGWPATTNYDDTSATTGTLYYYWVKATNASGVSYFSASDSGYSGGSSPVPAAPAGVTASQGTYTDKVQVIWGAVTNATGYTVWRSGTNDTNSASVLAGGIATTNYNDTSVAVNVIYYYWVKATNASGASAFSSSSTGWCTNYSSNVSAVACASLIADFDGDQLADPALYNTNGTWSLKLSGSGYALVPLAGFLGGSGYSAVAGDFDGDRIADPAVYQAATGTWLIKLSGSGYSVLPLANFLGGTDYVPLAGDFDGDRLADPAVYQAASGTWKVKLSTAGYLEIPKPDFLGETGWTAVAADFDGDRLVDPAIYEAATASWIVLLSSSGYSVYALDPNFLGGTGYDAMAADFDGDRLADPAVAEVSTGHWQIKLSSGGYSLLDLPNFLGE